MQQMNTKQKLTIITPVDSHPTAFQYANSVGLSMGQSDHWNLVFVFWGTNAENPPSMPDDLNESEQVHWVISSKDKISALNEVLTTVSDGWIVCLDEYTILGLDFVSNIYEDWIIDSEHNMVAAPVVLTRGNKPVREIGFNLNTIGVDELGLLYGNIVLVGQHDVYPPFEHDYYSSLLHTSRCIEVAQNDIKVLSGERVCAIQELESLSIEQELMECDRIISQAFTLGFGLANTLRLIKMFSRRKALLKEFNGRFDRDLDLDAYINIFHYQARRIDHV